ncbi:transposase [Marinifilum sp.]|uniref:transposase n=1 Tax=Marinifilum sp. TaxID=2033137 RepID=UPI003BAC01DF
MYFEEDYLYHVYNRSNNGVRIFYSHENYLFFLKKLRKHLTPYCSILAWCLMPTHFHLLIKVNCIKPENFNVDLNFSIGKLLASYTRALQKEQNFNGSLFQSHTKTKCLNMLEEITPSYWNAEFGARINTNLDDYSYPRICFNYIHMNPVFDQLVASPEDWEFSSYRDYFCERKGSLIDYELAKTENLIGEQL